MAKKSKTVFMCSECGNEYLSWQGQCSYCGAWNTIKEYSAPDVDPGDTRRRTDSSASPVKLSSVGASVSTRMSSGIGELDRVLGGGIVPGSLTLISGEPGIGKSTMIIEAANSVASSYGPVLYVSGEESAEQVKLRADRVCGDICDSLYIYSETALGHVLQACAEIKPCFLIIDSIQTMYSDDVDSSAGSVTQIRACSNLIMNYAKSSGVPVFIVAHVTKSGDLAGPKTIEHMVDCVLNFTGERDRDLRILRSYKNRFGTTDEIGAFCMTAEGMLEVPDLSGSLIESTAPDAGSVVSAVYEGSRAVFFEIQALAGKTSVGFARRTSLGINVNRLNMILAVLEKKAGIHLADYDIYVNLVGGMRSESTSTDLAVALAIYSSFRDRASSRKTVAVGEVGLTGHLRPVPNCEKIVNEAVRLGYDRVILPTANASQLRVSGIKLIGADNITDAIRGFCE